MSKNDEKILLLKKQIEEKEERLGKVKKFSSTTNCSINFEGSQININTLQKDGLILLLVKLNSLLKSALELELADQFDISGYNIGDWINDIKSKLEILNLKQEEMKLKQMKNRLDQLLSEDKRTELELEEIMKSL